MRSRLLVPLFLLFAVACGRYSIDQPGEAGTSGGGASDSAAGGSGAASAGTNASAGGAQATTAGNDAGGTTLGGSSSNELLISPASLPPARLNAAYVAQFNASGGAPSYTFRLVSGTLPAGLSLNDSGALAGSPRELGTFAFVVQVTDAAGVTARASLQLVVSRTRWLASETFISTASTQSLLSLIDLAQPQADPIVLDSQSALDSRFSGDGHWLVYTDYRSADQLSIYSVDMAGERPSTPQLLLNTRPHVFRGAGGTVPCQWAPDSSRLACLKDTGTADAPASTVVAFDTSGSELGPEVSIGPGERDLMFLDRDTLVYGYGADDFARVEWHGQALSEPMPLGVGGGFILQQSSDGARALLNRNPLRPDVEVDLALVDFRLGQAQHFDIPKPVPGTSLSLSADFDAAFMIEPPAEGDAGLGFYRYYAVNGTQATQVGHPPIEATTAYTYYRSAGARLVRSNGSQVFLETVANGTFTEQLVAGEYQSAARNVIRLELDAAAAWIYISTAQLDQQSHPIEATAEHWLSRVEAGQAQSAQLIGQGYLIQNESTTVLFSPDGQRLLLHGYNGYPHQDVPAAFRLFDLSDPTHIVPHALDLPFSWAHAAWSADSSYVSIIGGNSASHSRPLLVVDALAPSDPPRQIVACDSNPAPLPGCPASAAFQP